MQLWRTICTTDWKGRPEHHLGLIAESDSKEELIKKMDEDVRLVQAEDLAGDEYGIDLDAAAEVVQKEFEAAKKKFLNDPELAKKWPEYDYRWEMNREDKDGPRALVLYKSEGDVSTLVYHFV